MGVLYLTEAIDEYSISALPEFEGKKFQNVAKEGFQLDEGENAKKHFEEVKTEYEPLTKWLADDALKDQILKAEVSNRLTDSPSALVAGSFGYTGNMERLVVSNAHQKADDSMRNYYLSQKKTLEVNPRHPIIKELLNRVEDNPADDAAKDMAQMMFKTATLRSGYMLQDTVDFAKSIEKMMRQNLGVPLDAQVDEEVAIEEDGAEDESEEKEDIDAEGEEES